MKTLHNYRDRLVQIQHQAISVICGCIGPGLDRETGSHLMRTGIKIAMPDRDGKFGQLLSRKTENDPIYW